VATWIATLARSRAIDLSRVKKRRARREMPLEIERSEALGDPGFGPLDAASDRERATLLRGAVASLPPEQRSALELAFFEGLSHTEVALALGAPLGTVKTRIRTALATLRRTLASGAEEQETGPR